MDGYLKEMLATVQKMDIFFGHQSVGNNILDGIRLAAESEKVSDSLIFKSGEARTSGGIVHFQIGKNYDPLSKFKDFKEHIKKENPAPGSFLILKLCYADINAKSDLQMILAEYLKVVEDLKNAYPECTVLHSTVPVERAEPLIKRVLKRLLFRPVTIKADNRARYIYNQLLRREFGESLFDLAGEESSGDTYGKVQKYDTLLPVYTDDGGHLNRMGRVKVARSFIAFLVKNYEQGNKI